MVLAGYGVVGRSLHKMLEAKRLELLRDYSMDVKVVAIVDRGGAAINEKGLRYDEVYKVKKETGSVAYYEPGGRRGLSVSDVLDSVESEVYIDATPANFTDARPSIDYIQKAIQRRVHVVTCNKAPLALAMPALLEMAEYRGVKLLYSGAVGGGTPFLSFASKSLRGNKVVSVRGVLNGTTNYILYKMHTEGYRLEEALREAQRLGYAERDPTLDINGVDAAAKLVILVNHITKPPVYTLGDVDVNGIGSVSLDDVRRAKARGRALKLIASNTRGLRVSVEEVEERDPLNVPLNLNAVEFITKEVGSIYVIGKGAGGAETAASIIRDLVELRTG